MKWEKLVIWKMSKTDLSICESVGGILRCVIQIWTFFGFFGKLF